MKRVMFVLLFTASLVSSQVLAHGTKRPPIGPKPPVVLPEFHYSVDKIVTEATIQNYIQ